MKRTVLVVATLAIGALDSAEAQDARSAAAFAKFGALAGEWVGSFVWTGSRSGTGEMSATYLMTGNGSAVVENLTVGGAPVMTSVYHLDGSDLRVTHYCAAKNQPRLKADTIDRSNGSVRFSFVDATNLRAPDAPHVHGLAVRFLDADHVVLDFLFMGGDKHSDERVTLRRVSSHRSDNGPLSTP